MPTTTDLGHPLFVPNANREIANERAARLVGTISDYLAVKDTIPTGFNPREKILETRKRILDVLGGTDEDWNDWHWHIRMGIDDIDVLAKIIDLTDEEVADFDKTANLYRWKISPYYATLMDPKDHRCPVRMLGVPTGVEFFDREVETDPYASVFYSPEPLISRLYADRLIFNATNICCVFCRL